MNPTSEPFEESRLDQLLHAAFGATATREARADAPAATAITPRYRIEGEIGRGGVGVVLRGRDLELHRDVAIKILKPEHKEHDGLTRRLVEEAQIGGQLEHPGIVPVHEMGRAPDGRPFFAMKLVQGRTLAELLKERRSPADDAARWLAIFEQVCQTVAYAHARGVVHRDLKPANVMVGAFGEVQVADWGLAKVIGRPEAAAGAGPLGGPGSSAAVSTARTSSSEFLSQAGSVLGTLAYMPPEQARGQSEQVDARSDVFALGAMLCELLTGAPPYSGDVSAILEAAREGRVGPALERLERCGADRELIALARRCLAPERDARPRDASELAEAVSRHRAELAQRARSAELAAATAQAKASQERRVRRLVLALAATVVGAVLVGAGAWVKGERDRRERLDRAAQPVRELEGRARELLATARLGESDGIEPWREALAAADGAVAAATAGALDAASCARARALRDEIAEEVARAEAAAANRALDMATIEQLVLVLGKIGVWAYQEVDQEFESIYREWGLDFATMSDEAILERLRRSSDPIEMCDFLLAWMGVRATVARDTETGEPKDFARMMLAMQRADPDPWRVRIRGAIPHHVADLVKLVKDPATLELDSRTVVFLGLILASFDARAEAIELFRSVVDRHPTELVLHAHLADWLLEDDSARHEEALGHAGAAVGIAPELASSWLLLGRARGAVGDFEGAITALARTVVLNPASEPACSALATAQMRLGRVGDAIATLQAAIARLPDSDVLRYDLALARLQAGDLAAAREGLLAIVAAPRELPSAGEAADLLILLGDHAAASRGLQETLRTAHPTTPRHVVNQLRAILLNALIHELRFDAVFAELEQLDRRVGAELRVGLAALAALNDEMPDFVAGARAPEGPLETARVAFLLERHGDTAVSAELWDEALEAGADEVLADMPLARSYAARAALRAAARDGADASELDAAAQSRFRNLALAFVRAELDAALDATARDPTAKRRLDVALLTFDPALLPVRDPARRLLLPPAEAQAWQQLFAEVAVGLRLTREPGATD